MATNALRWRVLPVAGIVLITIVPAVAQTSANYKLTEATLDSGGNPGSAGSVTSAHFHVKLDAIGDGVIGSGISSASFRTDAGFVGRYPPPGEVTGLRWSGRSILQWNPEKSVGKYEVYRDLLGTLPGAFGFCFASDVPAEAATDASSPAAGQGYFYLVTARNRLGEEGPKGYRSNGAEEANPAPCP